MSSADNEQLPFPEEPLPYNGITLEPYSMRTFGGASYIGERVVEKFSYTPEYDVNPGGEYAVDMGFRETSMFYRNGFGGDESYREDYDFSDLKPRTGRYRDYNYGVIGDVKLEYDTSDAAVLARLPFISTDFRFVIDRRPAGEEDAYIPARVYTEYFANGQIPVAAPGHRLHSHDQFHAPSYARVFGIPEFAEMVRSAAGTALLLPDEEGSMVFTNAMDQFGDALIFDSIFNVNRRTFDTAGFILKSARTNLQKLVALYCKSPSEEPLKLGNNQAEVFALLWEKLGFHWRETRLGLSENPILSRYVQIESNVPLSDGDASGNTDRYGYYTRLRKPTTESGYDFSNWQG